MAKQAIVKTVRGIIDEGIISPKEVFQTLREREIEFSENSVYVILWEERNRRKIPHLRPRKNKEIIQ